MWTEVRIGKVPCGVGKTTLMSICGQILIGPGSSPETLVLTLILALAIRLAVVVEAYG